jgi:DEAD/DEAH box helicase domain-containing protein
MALEEVFFDVETKKLFSDIGSKDPSGLGVSLVSVYRRTLNDQLEEIEGEMISFWEDEIPKMWELFLKAKRIIGFNSLRFDVPALKPYAPKEFGKLPHFDIMDQIRRITSHGVSLNAIAMQTLKKKKTDSGLNAVYYYAKGDKESLAKLKKYCEADVRLTRDIYDYALKNKELLFKDRWNNLRKVALDFSHPEKPEEQKIQDSLF